MSKFLATQVDATAGPKDKAEASQALRSKESAFLSIFSLRTPESSKDRSDFLETCDIGLRVFKESLFNFRLKRRSSFVPFRLE